MRALPRSIVAWLLLVSPSCGYALVGRGTVVDPTIKRIGVPLFTDATGKAGLDQRITQKVIEELLKRGKFDVVQEGAGVDALVEGQILSYTAVPVGFTGTGAKAQARTQASRYAITVTAKIKYTKLGQTEPIWESDAFSFRDEYDVGDAATFFDREDQSIERLATSFARSLVAAMLEGF